MQSSPAGVRDIALSSPCFFTLLLYATCVLQGSNASHYRGEERQKGSPDVPD